MHFYDCQRLQRVRNVLLKSRNILRGNIDVAETVRQSLCGRMFVHNVEPCIKGVRAEVDSYQVALRAHLRSVDMLLDQTANTLAIVSAH